jgi:acyl carrier protein
MLVLETIINEILDDAGRPPISQLNAELRLRDDLGLNSLELAVLTVRIEEQFGVDVFAEGMVTTIGEVIAKLTCPKTSQ